MAVTAKSAKAFALALPEASEKAHFDRIAIRTPRRIFATLAGDGRDINLMFDPDLQAHYVAMDAAFAPVPGGWGKMGATRCDLKAVDAATLKSALAAAHARAMAPPVKKAKRKP